MFRLVSRFAVAYACAFAAAWASDVVPQAAVGVPEGPQAPKLVVLRNGSVVEGEIRFAQGGYEVHSRNGRVFLADSYVWFTADHRRHAYEQLTERVPCRTADDHVSRARWCLTNRLYSCAQEEVAIALEQEPQHQAARTLLTGLHEMQNIAAPARQKSTPSLDDPEVLGGLPPYVAEEFVTQIQPLLVNRCSNANCHGAKAGNGFVLSVVRSGSPAFQRLTSSNLDAVRGQLSESDPAASPLLDGTKPGHGRQRKELFPGPAGAAQVEALSRWVAHAARASAKPTEEASTDLPALAVAGDGPFRTAEAEPIEDAAVMPASDTRNSTDATGELLKAVLLEERPDAFDPEVFNRRHAAKIGGPSQASNKGPTR